MAPLRRALGYGFAGLSAVATVLGFIWDAQSNNANWAIWLGFVGLVVGVVIALWPEMSSRVRHLFRSLRESPGRIRGYNRLKITAARWEQRALAAEGKLSNWNEESVKEGRRRAHYELLAAVATSGFGDVVLMEDDQGVMIGAALTSGDPPPPGSIFLVEGTLLPDILCRIRCVGYEMTNGAVLFRPDTYGSMTAEQLLKHARDSRALPRNYRITARAPSDDFTSER